MSTVRRLLSPFKSAVDRRLEVVTAPRLDQLSAQIEEVRRAAVDLRRIVTDDLDASNETSALVGRALEELRSTVVQLESEVASLRARLDR